MDDDFDGLVVRPRRWRPSEDADKPDEVFALVRFQGREIGRSVSGHRLESFTSPGDDESAAVSDLNARAAAQDSIEIDLHTKLNFSEILDCMEQNHRSIDMEFVYIETWQLDNSSQPTLLGIARFCIGSVCSRGERHFVKLPVLLPKAARGSVDVDVSWSGRLMIRCLEDIRRTPVFGVAQLFGGAPPGGLPPFGFRQKGGPQSTTEGTASVPIFGRLAAEPVLDARAHVLPIPGSAAVRPAAAGWLVLTPLRLLFFPDVPEEHSWEHGHICRHRHMDVMEMPLGNVKELKHEAHSRGSRRLDICLQDERRVSFLVGSEWASSKRRGTYEAAVPVSLQRWFAEGLTPDIVGVGEKYLALVPPNRHFRARVSDLGDPSPFDSEQGETDEMDVLGQAVLKAAIGIFMFQSVTQLIPPFLPLHDKLRAGIDTSNSAREKLVPDKVDGQHDPDTAKQEGRETTDRIGEAMHAAPFFRSAWVSGLRGGVVDPQQWCVRLVQEIEWRCLAGQFASVFGALLQCPVSRDRNGGCGVCSSVTRQLASTPGRLEDMSTFLSTFASTAPASLEDAEGDPIAGIDLFSSLEREYKRMGIDRVHDEKPPSSSVQISWRVSAANVSYDLCDTYPNAVGVPAHVSDEQLLQAREQRSGHRLPVLSWIHPTTGAPLVRSAQLQSGNAKAVNFDTLLLRAVRDCCEIPQSRLNEEEVDGDVPGSFMGTENKEESDDELLTLHLLNARLGEPYEGEEDGHVTYPIDVSVFALEGDTRCPYDENFTIHRRFSDFSSLSDGLAANDIPEKSRMPALPRKTLFSPRVGTKALEERSEGLRKLLEFVVSVRVQSAADLSFETRTTIDEFFDVYRERVASRKNQRAFLDRQSSIGSVELFGQTTSPTNSVASTGHVTSSGFYRRRARKQPDLSKFHASVSMKHSASVKDEAAVESAPVKNGSQYTKQLRILDARPMLHAMANALMRGKGIEKVDEIGGHVELAFADIANIHVMQQCLRALAKAAGEISGGGGLLGTESKLGVRNTRLLSQSQTGQEEGVTSTVSDMMWSPLADSISTSWNLSSAFKLSMPFSTSSDAEATEADSPHRADGDDPRRSGSATEFTDRYSEDHSDRGKNLASATTEWVSHGALLLQAASWGADMLENGQALLVHCSDGWDRTSQISGLIKLLLDPFYRTIKGFNELIRTTWSAFGHRFETRLRGGEDGEDSKQRSPIFLQFLEACTHLLHQFPFHFEFTQRYLQFIADMAYSATFIEFMGDSELERQHIARRILVHCEQGESANEPREQLVVQSLLSELGLMEAPEASKDTGAPDYVTRPAVVLEGLRYAEAVAMRHAGLLFLNPAFTYGEKACERSAAEGLVPICDPTGLVIWRKYHLRFSAATASERYTMPSLDDWLWEKVVENRDLNEQRALNERKSPVGEKVAENRDLKEERALIERKSPVADETETLRAFRANVKKLLEDHRGRTEALQSVNGTLLDQLEQLCGADGSV